MDWRGRKVLVTGGASFIGSHLLDALVELGAQVRIVDNFSSGKLENIKAHLNNGKVEVCQGDLLEPGVAEEAFRTRFSPSGRPRWAWLRGSAPGCLCH